MIYLGTGVGNWLLVLYSSWTVITQSRNSLLWLWCRVSISDSNFELSSSRSST